MADFGGFNLFPIGATGFEPASNPLQPVTATSSNTKSFFDFSLPDFKIPGQDSLSKVLHFFDTLTEGSTWERVGIVIMGLVFVAIGLYLLGNRTVLAVKG